MGREARFLGRAGRGPFGLGLCSVVAGVLLGCGTVAEAIVAPGAVAPGGQYRLAFVTDGMRDALSGDIGVYNAFVTAQGGLSGLTSGVSYFVIGSTGTVHARDNTMTNPFTDGAGVPIYLVDGVTKIADGNGDLWDGSIDAPLNLTQTGVLLPSVPVATGSDEDGTTDDEFNAYFGAGDTDIGTTDRMDLGWISRGDDFPGGFPHRFYALSEVLTKPAVVPLPGAAWAGLPLLGWLGWQVRGRG